MSEVWSFSHGILLFSTREFGGEGATGAFAAVEFVEGGAEIGDGEIRPALGEEDEFGEGAFPQKEIGEALLAAGADEEINIGGAAAMDFGEDLAEGIGGEFGDFVEFEGGVKDGCAGGVVDGEADVETRAVRGDGFGVGDDLAERGGDAVAASDDG